MIINPKLEILYQDQDIVAIHKPAGMLVHRTNLDSQESIAALQVLRDQINQIVYPVHRLDRPTSGVLIFALSSEMASNMMKDFAEKKVQKKYLAVVRGQTPKSCTIDYALKEEIDRLSDKRTRVDKPAQPAVTEVATLGTVELPYQVDRYATTIYSLVLAQPKTGRKHQIRRHLRHLGHPVIGDVNHGVGKHNRFFKEKFNSHRLLLACLEMSFHHPRTSENLTIKASLGEDYLQVLEKLGFTESLVSHATTT